MNSLIKTGHYCSLNLKISLFLGQLWIFCSIAFSQQEQLQKILDAKPQNDETIAWLYDSATALLTNNPSLSQSIGEIAFEKAMEWNTNAFNSILIKQCIGDALLIQEEFEASIDAYKEALILLQNVEDKESNHDIGFTKLTIQLSIAKVEISTASYDDAGLILDNSLVEAKSLGFREIEQLIFELKKEMYEKTQDYDLALQAYAKMASIEDELQNLKIDKTISELKAKYEDTNREREIAELEKENALERSFNYMLAIVLGTTFLVLILIVVFSTQKRKKEQLINQLELQQLSRKIISKTNEITTYTLNFLQKNQLMEDLKEQINDLKNSSTINKNKELTRINRIVDNTFRSDEEWKTFQITFDQMHDGFFKDLKEEFPNISNAELKLCALLRLNMNLKESAKILGIAPDSVKTARYRLRKKLGLKTEDNLIDFLLQFERSKEQN